MLSLQLAWVGKGGAHSSCSRVLVKGYWTFHGWHLSLWWLWIVTISAAADHSDRVRNRSWALRLATFNGVMVGKCLWWDRQKRAAEVDGVGININWRQLVCCALESLLIKTYWMWHHNCLFIEYCPCLLQPIFSFAAVVATFVYSRGSKSVFLGGRRRHIDDCKFKF